MSAPRAISSESAQASHAGVEALRRAVVDAPVRVARHRGPEPPVAEPGGSRVAPVLRLLARQAAAAGAGGPVERIRPRAGRRDGALLAAIPARSRRDGRGRMTAEPLREVAATRPSAMAATRWGEVRGPRRSACGAASAQLVGCPADGESPSTDDAKACAVRHTASPRGSARGGPLGNSVPDTTRRSACLCRRGSDPAGAWRTCGGPRTPRRTILCRRPHGDGGSTCTASP